MLPASELRTQSHPSAVGRKRRAVIATMIERLEAEKRKGREDD